MESFLNNLLDTMPGKTKLQTIKELLYSIKKRTLTLGKDFSTMMHPSAVVKSHPSMAADVNLVLSHCSFQRPIPFWLAIPHWKQAQSNKLSEGSYGEVFRSIRYNGSPVIIKTFPVGGKHPEKPTPHLTFRDITSEVVCSVYLSKLNSSSYDAEFISPNFPKCYKISCVQGKYPDRLFRAWAEYCDHSSDPTDHPRPDLYSEGQLVMVIESEYCGDHLRSEVAMGGAIASTLFTGYEPCDFGFYPEMKEPLRGKRFHTRNNIIRAIGHSCSTINRNGSADGIYRLPEVRQKEILMNLRNAMCGLSLFTQVAVSLAIAETAYQFEHRDLHIANILLKETASKFMYYAIDGIRFKVQSCGLRASIIDYTLSRIRTEEGVFYIDMTGSAWYRSEGLGGGGRRYSNPWLENRHVYRQMSKVSGDAWAGHHPYTNILWLRYLLEQVLHLLETRLNVEMLEGEVLGMLRNYRDTVLSYNSARNFAYNRLFLDNLLLTVHHLPESAEEV